MPWWRVPVVCLLGALGVYGAFALATDLEGVLRWVPLTAFVLASVLRIFFGRLWWSFVIVLPGAATVALLVLIGANAALGKPLDEPLPPLPGFLLGAAIVGTTAWAYVRWWTFRQDWWEGVRAVTLAAIAAVVVTLGPPAAAIARDVVVGDDQALRLTGRTASELEVLVLTDDGAPAAPRQVSTRGWTVRTWTGALRDDGAVEWGAGEAPAPLPAEDVDRVLLVRGRGDPERWLRAADAVTPVSTPTFAVVDPGDAGAQAAWTAALRGDGVTQRRGRALQGAGVTADLAVEAAELAPTSAQDLALAARHRPVLLFGTGEERPQPYNVDRLIRSGKMEICAADRTFGRRCEEVDEPRDLDRDGGRLHFDPDELAKEVADPTIYVNVTRSGNDHPNAIYLDYWWYFPDNPAEAAGGAMCGAGLNVAGITCFDHRSDWEGVTVVVDEDVPRGSPTAVHYAQHDDVVRYGWPALEEIWDRGIRAEHGRGVNTAQRPLVFVSKGRHASYPMPCGAGGEGICRTHEVPHDPRSRPVKDASFDGGAPWAANGDACLPTCITALPTRDAGRQRASWHAYAGRWGTANCVLHVLCDTSRSPYGPGEQDRYLAPWCADRSIDFRDGAFSPRSGLDCPGREPTAQERSGGGLLMVALGDSFSSGQGAGRYHPGTTGNGNTCFRSSGAWPPLLARSQGWVLERFLACSGARAAEVVRDGARTDERERSQSQTGRIKEKADVVTLTIGGNDIGFAAVVTSCVLGDCVEKYDKPSGDVLDGRIDRLRDELPGVYRAVRDAADGARLVVLDYPRLLPDGSPEERADNCAAPERALTAAEVAYLNDKTRRLDAAIAAAAREAEVEFVEVIDAFAGHELRCGTEPWVNPARVEGELRPASFHPTAAGHIQLADAVARSLAGR